MSSILYISKVINVFCQDFNVFFTYQRLQCLLTTLQCLHLHFKRLQCLQSFMLSKDYNVIIYISKDLNVFSHYAFKRLQCLHLHFRRLQCLQSFTFSKDYNVFIYISKDFNIFSHLRFQKTTMSSFTFQRLQHLLSFIELNVLLFVLCRTRSPLFYALKKYI